MDGVRMEEILTSKKKMFIVLIQREKKKMYQHFFPSHLFRGTFRDYILLVQSFCFLSLFFLVVSFPLRPCPRKEKSSNKSTVKIHLLEIGSEIPRE